MRFCGNTALFIVLVLLCGCTKQYYTNPVAKHGSDPWIVKENGKYYYCTSRSGGIAVSVSDDLTKINPTKLVWKAEQDKWNSTNIWAPELHKIGDRWYIPYAAGKSGPPFTYQRAGVLESVTDDPLGEYVDKGMVYTGDTLGNWESNRWAIDMTYFHHNGKLYCIWSGWEDLVAHHNTPQNLYIAEMSDPWTAKTPRVLISEPDMDYELAGGHLPLNEGPQILESKKHIFIVYSCGQSWLDTYKLSWLRLKHKNADPMVRENWIKSPEAVFESTENVFGVGHASFATSPNGKENYIIYHAKHSRKPGWARDVRMQKFYFDKEGYPVFGKPVDSGVELPMPAGTKRK